MSIHPVILCGGAGTRLWPLSRKRYPKQLLALHSEQSLLQDTVQRVSGDGFAAPLVICNAEHRFIVASQLQDIIGDAGEIVLEPEGRSTAPAAAVAALLASESNDDVLILLLAADNVVRKPEKFVAAVQSATGIAKNGRLVTFGIEPDNPETAYGYIHRGTAIEGHEGCFNVRQFVEKPDAETAGRFLDSGEYMWNGGMFLFSAQVYLEELKHLDPTMLKACREAISQGRRDLDFFRLDPEAFAASPSQSIDYAVMEKTDRAAVVPVEMGWSDVGSWSSLWEIAERDADGNVVLGDVMAEDVAGSYLRSDGPMLAAIGLNDMIVVATQDAILVTPRDRAQSVKDIVERLERGNRSEHMSHVRVYRPWGWYQSTDAGEKFQVKRLCVDPGAKLSLQYHEHRAEHWVVVKGTARVTRGDEQMTLVENESTFIPVGVNHRLENPGHEPLHIIEVQSGDYLGEDDIVRIEDDFNRT
jgi:mannose-1-phosphate guanylyltransferase/mannose-6-phosphate isomerase